MAKTDMLREAAQHLTEPALTTTIVKEATIPDTHDARHIEQLANETIPVYKADKATTEQLKTDFNIDSGEATALALCTNHDAAIVTDDKKAINAARVLNIPFTTTPNTLIALYEKDVFTPEATRSRWQKLQRYGRYSDQITEAIEEDLP